MKSYIYVPHQGHMEVVGVDETEDHILSPVCFQVYAAKALWLRLGKIVVWVKCS